MSLVFGVLRFVGTFMLGALAFDGVLSGNGEIVVFKALAFDGTSSRRDRHIALRAFAFDGASGWRSRPIMLRALALDASSERNVSLRLLFRFEISDG